MSRKIKPKILELVADGRTIEIKKPSKLNFELNKALKNPSNFKDFVDDPKAFAAKYDLQIDPEISGILSQELRGVNSIDDLNDIVPEPPHATAWAVAKGYYSVATSKIALAF